MDDYGMPNQGWQYHPHGNRSLEDQWRDGKTRLWRRNGPTESKPCSWWCKLEKL